MRYNAHEASPLMAEKTNTKSTARRLASNPVRGTIFRSPVQGRTSTACPGTCVDCRSLSTARGDVQRVQLSRVQYGIALTFCKR